MRRPICSRRLIVEHLAAAAASVVLASGCHLFGSDKGPGGGGPRDQGVGDECGDDFNCRAGLSCVASGDVKVCRPRGDGQVGDPCLLSAECLAGHHCAPGGRCAPSGMFIEGGPCAVEADCATGLVCLTSGLFGKCGKPGVGDVGDTCTKLADCLAGLGCKAGACSAGGPGTPWAGAKCDDAAEPTPKVYFKVPRAGDTHQDFYRLPFPNDIRIKAGKVDLAGHPTPGIALLPADLVNIYLREMEKDLTGFGVSQAVYFRFSRDLKFESLRVPNALSWVDITPGSPGYGGSVRYDWLMSNGGGKYICPRFIAMHPALGHPLRAGTTYAVMVRSLATDADGKPMGRDDDFAGMLGPVSPSDAALGAAWKAYEPLRAWIADKSVDAATISAAAVFTTQKPEEPAAKLREAVRAAAAPALGVKELWDCASTAPRPAGPCHDGATRGCLATGTGAVIKEWQGTVGLPIFQKGTAPYETQADGGEIEVDAGSGLPKIQRVEDVCFSLSIPSGAAPAGGWPTVVFAHGTDGDYRTHVSSGLAGDFAAIPLGGGSVGLAVIGIDGVAHGPRKGGSAMPSSDLVYNFMNPDAARDNALQAVADQFSLARLVEAFPAGTSGIALDATKIYFYGHSQGGNAGAIAVGYEPLFAAAVLSGTGGTLKWSLIGKRSPVNIAGALPLILAESYGVDEYHPIVNLMQMFFERSDPVNFGRRLLLDPPAGSAPRHVLQTFGVGDTYTPGVAMQSLAIAAGLGIWSPPFDDFEASKNNAPVKGNVVIGGKAVTAIHAQWRPGMFDGHFVATRDPAARAAVARFIASAAQDGTPTFAP